ncbi:MAG: hypothetical protein GX607_17205 [Myxococcales bacterium]|jgi:hypothetical protein|nr:hypothetical protein [Myxococcales bacterium]
MQLPPLQVTRAVIQRYARVLARYGDELGQRPLVLPNGDFFPDRFEGDQASLERLVSRLQEHAGMADIPIQATVIPRDADAAPKGGGCSSGACHVPSSTGTGIPRLVDLGDGWVVQVPEQELSHPVALTTNLSRSLAYVFLVETQHEGEIIEPPVDVTADFVAVALGLGALMMQGAYIYAKSCGGPSIASVTKVGVGELAVAFAAFIAMRKHSFRDALRELDTTQRAVLEESRDLIESNRALVELLARDPERVAQGTFELHEGTGWFGRLFTRRRKPTSVSAELGDLDEALSIEEVESMLIAMPAASQVGHSRSRGAADPAREELKALVSEALVSEGLRASR